MAEERQDGDPPEVDGPVVSPSERLLRRTVTVRVIVLVLLAIGIGGVGVAGGYFLGHGGSPRPVTPPAAGGRTTVAPSATVPAPPTVTVSTVGHPSRSAPVTRSAALTSSVIAMRAACRWAYPGKASGKISGSNYSIVCLAANGLVLGGFNGIHSLSAWCLDDQHTDGARLPDPELVNGVWTCTRGNPASQAPATSQPAPTASPSSPAGPAASPSPSQGPTAIAIPMGAACIWAYPGKASGKFSGSDYSIACLGAGGQVLGGFSGSHSLNAWCADPSHTDGQSLPNPALVSGEWLCTA